MAEAPLRWRTLPGLRPIVRSEGQALVELALILTPVLILLLGIADFGRGFYAAVAAQQAAREAARMASGGSASAHIYVSASDCPAAENPCLGLTDQVKASLGSCGGCPDLLALVGTEPTIHVGGYQPDGTKFGYADGSLAAGATLPGATCPINPCSGGQIQVEVIWEVPVWTPLMGSIVGSPCTLVTGPSCVTVRSFASAQLV